MTAPAEPTDIETLRAAAEAATPGPWTMFERIRGAFEVCKASSYALGGVCCPHIREDATFIALANPATILALLDEMDADKAALAEAKQQAEHYPKVAGQNLRLRTEIERLRETLSAVAPEMRREHDAGDGHFSTEQVEAVETLAAAHVLGDIVNGPSISPSDPYAILAGIRQFGLAGDGADLQDLRAAFDRLHARADAAEDIARGLQAELDHARRIGEGYNAERAAAEAECERLRAVLREIADDQHRDREFRWRCATYPREARFDFLAHIQRQREWSERTIGPGDRAKGIVDHIRKELAEIEVEPRSTEWIDVVILALDGMWRAGFTPSEIVAALVAKQAKNEARKWPDWRTVPHDRSMEAPTALQEPERSEFEAWFRTKKSATPSQRGVVKP